MHTSANIYEKNFESNENKLSNTPNLRNITSMYGIDIIDEKKPKFDFIERLGNVKNFIKRAAYEKMKQVRNTLNNSDSAVFTYENGIVVPGIDLKPLSKYIRNAAIHNRSPDYELLENIITDLNSVKNNGYAVIFKSKNGIPDYKNREIIHKSELIPDIKSDSENYLNFIEEINTNPMKLISDIEDPENTTYENHTLPKIDHTKF